MKSEGAKGRARFGPLLLGVLVITFSGCAGDKKTVLRRVSAAEGRAFIAKWVSGLPVYPGSVGRPPALDQNLQEIVDKALVKVFPQYTFFSLHYPEWPVTFGPGTPALTSRNVLAVGPDGTVALLNLLNPKSLEHFFRSHLRSPENHGPFKRGRYDFASVVHAWLRLSEEFSQDGFFRFVIRDDLVSAGGMQSNNVASGVAIVEPHGGNLGLISVIFRFYPDGRLESVSECRNVFAGERPICQALKLLDPDPVVREMARRSLLVMGRAAKEYLDERRTEATPELKQEIDRVWAQIVREGR